MQHADHIADFNELQLSSYAKTQSSSSQ